MASTMTTLWVNELLMTLWLRFKGLTAVTLNPGSSSHPPRAFTLGAEAPGLSLNGICITAPVLLTWPPSSENEVGMWFHCWGSLSETGFLHHDSDPWLPKAWHTLAVKSLWALRPWLVPHPSRPSLDSPLSFYLPPKPEHFWKCKGPLLMITSRKQA